MGKRKSKTSSGSAKRPAQVTAEMVEAKTKARAANKIVRFWRIYNMLALGHLIINFTGAGLLEVDVKKLSFEALIVFLREKSTIAAARALLMRVHRLSTILHGFPPNSDESVNVRVFLAMYMIALRPSHVFEEINVLERALMDAANRLLRCFESIISQVLARNFTLSSVDFTLQSSFATLLFDYLTKFKAWKIPDEGKLTCRIKHALVALYEAQKQLPPDEPEDSKLKIEFKTQIERLSTKLRQIAGVDALNDFNAQRSSGTVVIANGPITRCAPISFRTAMTNQQLAHELLLDPSFQLDSENPNSESCLNRIREGFHRAFWDSLVDDLKCTPPCYFRVMRLMREFRDGLAEVGCRAGRIDEVLDLQLISDRIAANAFPWVDVIALVSSIVAVIKGIQLPARDADTSAKWLVTRQQMEVAEVVDQPCSFSKALEFLFSRLSYARIDCANARLKLIAPVIRDHGVAYETGKYADKFNAGEVTDENLEEWINCSLAKTIQASPDQSMTVEALKSGNPGEFLKVLSTGFCQLILDQGVFKIETFGMDVDRLHNLYDELDCATTITAMLAGLTADTTRLLRAGKSTSDDRAEHVLNCSTQVLKIVKIVAENVKDCKLFDIAEVFLFNATNELSSTTLDYSAQKEILEKVVKYGNQTNAVHVLFKARINSFWKKHFDGTVIDEADIQQIHHAVALFPRIIKAADAARHVFNLNVQVHRERYNRLIQAAAEAVVV